MFSIKAASLLILINSIRIQSQNVQSAILFDQTGNNGANMTTFGNMPDMGSWDNRAQSTCATGIWLYYARKDYNKDQVDAMEYIFGPSGNPYCVDFYSLQEKLSSLRYVGFQSDYTSDTFSVYEKNFFQSSTQWVSADTPSFDLVSYHMSLIVTGTSPWTIYTQRFYGGVPTCLSKGNDTVPRFVTDLVSVGVPYGSIASVRKGCFTTNVIDLDAFKPNNNHGSNFFKE